MTRRKSRWGLGFEEEALCEVPRLACNSFSCCTSEGRGICVLSEFRIKKVNLGEIISVLPHESPGRALPLKFTAPGGNTVIKQPKML